MALNINRLTLAIEIQMKALYSEDNMYNNQGDSNYTIHQLAHIIASCVINEFTSFAKCDGFDSHGDTHGNVGIV